ncbi:hypothetical protein FP371_17510 [Citrobacter freundii]|uniref:hypothetical protein n=1 Tax=Citrobacter freundii TaxID=546 RepID=UPI0013D3F2FE|nr:hypothetical protein [Citrobacter freundii]EKL0722450.1 hypothetical protein [Citrobacter freundii]EKW2052972.1 hypothetical protein [Citrobacter freundii]MBY5300040.1 hypothetical protein [Citrobacter freundii]NGF04411.1 hypothetical protein [Citrobacter freundii]HCC5905667.1 hypothetical protein [Citrobacter freundii]
MAFNKLKNNNIYFYFYMAAPSVLPLAYFFTMNDKAAFAVFCVVALICVFLDLRELKKTDENYVSFVGSALGIVVLPPIYVYGRARDAGMKKWRWLLTYVAIALGAAFISTTIDDNEALKKSACEITTSIFIDKESDVQCLAVEDVKKVSDKHYRAKAVLSNGVDMPITIEERDDDYIYVTLAPLSSLLD